MKPDDTTSAPKSFVLHSMASYYDLLAAVMTLGREREFRDRLATLVDLAPGERVLDVGCGTGSLALACKRRVGRSGTVTGIDASPEMIERARRKASNKGDGIHFEVARVESLPFPNESFDVVLSTLMMHHLPRVIRERCVSEMRRVLRPGGRLLVVDFEKPAHKRGGLIARFHRHGGVPLRDIVDLIGGANLRVTQIGDVGVSDLRFALASKPRDGDDSTPTTPVAERSLPPLSMPKWPWIGAALGVVAVHLVIVRGMWAAVTIGTLASVAVAGVVLAHVGMAGGAAAIAKRHRRQ
jgi:ubiquinone/menaquinone biosynthesis C-methylase UbiE